MSIYDDPLITYNGQPTDAFFVQLLAKIEATPGATVTALQATTIPVNAVQMNSATVIGNGSEANPWRGEGVPV